jgi:hypothetical protein
MTSEARARLFKWLIATGVLLLLIVVSGFIWASVRLKPKIRERVVTALKEHYNRDVELKGLSISLTPRFSAVGEGLIIHQKDRPGLPPMIIVDRMSIDATWRGMFSQPLQVDRLTLNGLQINVPPKIDDPNKTKEPRQKPPQFLINEVIADGTTLNILPKKEGKEPLVFDISKLKLHSAGTTAPMKFDAILSNPKPPGDIQSAGEFGPWQSEDPSLTPVSGSYTFNNADLSIFKGIGGKLSSEGTYQGLLERIVVDGWTDTPDFSLKVSGHEVHLKTQFHAIVDGTDGDTYLEPVNAQFGQSSVVASGGVYGKPGMKGKTIALDITVSNSRVEDMLRLAVKGSEPLMTGAIAFRAKFELPPGDQDILEKLSLDGNFGVDAARFTSLSLQEKINELSQRARGKVGEETVDERVVSDMRGRFALGNGRIRFSNLTFMVPGALVELEGTYALQSETLDFTGTLRTDAKISQMTTGIKSIFLKLIDPIFKKQGAGAVIPIKITGTREQPKYSLDFGRVF